MTNKLFFGYLGVFIKGLIILDTVQMLLADNHLNSLRYSGIILIILSGISWGIYGVQNKLLPTAFISLFQTAVFTFIFLLKYYNGVNNKDGITSNRTKVSELDEEDNTK